MRKLYDNKGNSFAELNYSEEYFLDYSRHSHDSFSITVFGTGEVEVEFHSVEEELVSSNQIIIFNPNQVHQTKSEIKKTRDYFTLHIDTKWCRDKQIELFGFEEEFTYVQNIIDDEYLSKEIFSIFKNIIQNENNSNEKLENIIINILEKYTILDLKKRDSKEHFLCKKVKNYILENLEEQITLEDISKVVGYNESYVSRVFKKEFGLSPYAFLIDKRVQKAKNRLLDGSRIDLSQLSSEVGFYDQSHFSKAFKRTFATTPKKYIPKKKKN